MNWRSLLTILYGLLLIWIGLWRSILAQEFKPNAFYFCLVTGLVAIAGGYAYRLGQCWIGAALALLSVGTVLSFYTYCFITDPASDATYRVGLAIVASVAQICVITLPRSVPSDKSPRN